MDKILGTIEHRVQKGVELLNEKAPGWIKKIDLKTFNIHNEANCVLGQVFGSYFVGKERVCLKGHSMIPFGFVTFDLWEKRELQNEWIRVLELLTTVVVDNRCDSQEAELRENFAVSSVQACEQLGEIDRSGPTVEDMDSNGEA